MFSKILLTYGFHPLEVSAFYLAPKVADRFRYDPTYTVKLVRFPYRKTNLHLALEKARGKKVDPLYALRKIGYPYFRKMRLPQHDLHIDFHNRKIEYLEATKDKSLEDYVCGIDCGDITFLPSHLDRTHTYALEIPAFWKPAPKRIQKAVGEGYWDDQVVMVDFKKTKEHGLLSDLMVNIIVRGIRGLEHNLFGDI